LHYLSICVLLLSEGWHRETDHQPGKGEHIFIVSYGGQDFLLPDDLPQDFLRGCRTQYCHLSARLIRIYTAVMASLESRLYCQTLIPDVTPQPNVANRTGRITESILGG
jgi:hypothetical protein